MCTVIVMIEVEFPYGSSIVMHTYWSMFVQVAAKLSEDFGTVLESLTRVIDEVEQYNRDSRFTSSPQNPFCCSVPQHTLEYDYIYKKKVEMLYLRS